MIRECECPEEGTRNVVAECLGKLTLIDPPTLLPKLKEHLKTSSPLIRATVVTAVKFTISDQVRVLGVNIVNGSPHFNFSLLHSLYLPYALSHIICRYLPIFLSFSPTLLLIHVCAPLCHPLFRPLSLFLSSPSPLAPFLALSLLVSRYYGL